MLKWFFIQKTKYNFYVRACIVQDQKQYMKKAVKIMEHIYECMYTDIHIHIVSTRF